MQRQEVQIINYSKHHRCSFFQLLQCMFSTYLEPADLEDGVALGPMAVVAVVEIDKSYLRVR